MGEEVEKLERVRVRHVEEEVLQWIAEKPDHHFSFPFRGPRQRPLQRLPKCPEAQGGRRPCIAPSFFRKARQRTSYEMIKLCVGATISSESVPGQNIVLVRPRTLGQTNPKEHNGLVPMEGDEEIFEEEAICKFCSDILKEENILKTECKCGNALIHEECAANWSRTRGNNYCDSCEQEVQTFPVALVRWLSSSTQMVGREENNKWSLSSWLMRRFGRLEFLNIFCLLRAISAVASPNIKGATDEGHNLISIFNLMSLISIYILCNVAILAVFTRAFGLVICGVRLSVHFVV
ncbi:unnamed protein product [Camellia sinensis]